MQDLNVYLTSQFYADKQEVEVVGRLMGEVINTIVGTFDEQHGWPYQISHEGVATISRISQSTTAMVSLALSKLLPSEIEQKVGVNRLPFAPERDEKEITLILKTTNKARALLVNDICKGRKARTISSSFGINDPITFSFVAAHYALETHDALDKKWKRIRDLLSRETRKRCRVTEPANAASLLQPPDNDHRVIPNAVIPLRVVQTVTSLQLSRRPELSRYRRYFESTLHDNLSFSAIPDSRFDPAELAFCLEGLLLSQPEAVDRSVFSRVLAVLGEAQKENAFWRPSKPFIATSKGLSLFPISVDIANALMRACHLFDGDELFDTFSSSSISLFRRYWQWLRARMIRLRVGGVDYVGWNSEHVNDARVIHVWETSQVLEFLIAYRRHLQAHIGRNTLVLSRFNVKTTAALVHKPWKQIILEYEPVKSLGQSYKIYSRVEKDFVKGWRHNDKKSYSMLLYGPPGTGKTTLAENLAKFLRFRIINISVSDFISAGSGEIEARAKAIFDVLNSQSNCVVLLDEIDQLVLDRDSARYSQQQDVFQFMTPGMLTKLNDLRAGERIIFVIATNYENRIDSAIKRAGRIDRQYLVLPPDRGARRRILGDILKDMPVDSEVNPAKIVDGDWKRLVSSSLFLSFKDIEGAINALPVPERLTINRLVTALDNRPRTITLATYGPRFADTKEVPPAEEFLCLVAMALEGEPFGSRGMFEGAGADLLKDAAKWLFKKGKSNINQAVDAHAPLMPKRVRKRVTDVLRNSL
jgi:hypothetical protein